jgi:DNA uptake protein ComE-like DNA-binding protein
MSVCRCRFIDYAATSTVCGRPVLPIRGTTDQFVCYGLPTTEVGVMQALCFVVLAVSVFGVTMLCRQSAANAQTTVAASARPANDRNGTERKVRVVLPSPYEQTDTRLKAAKATQPASSTMPLATEPATGVPDAATSKALTFGQPIQASTLTAPAAPQSGSAYGKPFKNLTGRMGNGDGGKHDLNVASLADLNGLEGGGNIGRAIITGRPYRSSGELVTRRVLSRAAYERIKAQISVGTSSGHIDNSSTIPPVRN